VTIRLCSNLITQNEKTVNISHSMEELGGYSLLVPSRSKIKHNIVRAETTSVEEHDNGFLQFGIYDQISKSSNIFNSSLNSPCQAAASVMPDRPKSTFVLALLFCPINILWNFPGVCRPPLPSRLPQPGGAPAYGVSSSPGLSSKAHACNIETQGLGIWVEERNLYEECHLANAVSRLCAGKYSHSADRGCCCHYTRL